MRALRDWGNRGLHWLSRLLTRLSGKCPPVPDESPLAGRAGAASPRAGGTVPPQPGRSASVPPPLPGASPRVPHDADPPIDARGPNAGRDLLRQTIVEPIADAAPPPAGVRPAGRAGHGPDRRDDRLDLCRPTCRPGVPVLWVLDDGRQTGELIRMRKPTLVIGRTVGDVRIPHDEQIFDPHAEIVRRGPKLLLRDLVSTTGTFVRIREALVVSGQELRIGTKRYRIEELGPLVRLEGEGRLWEWQFQGGEVIIGRAPGCWALAGSQDQTLSPWHARLWPDEAGLWHLADANSLNGTWLRFAEVEIDQTAEFLLGEQRFRLEVSQGS